MFPLSVFTRSSGEGAGPKDLSNKTMLIHDLPILTHTQLARAKLRAYSKRDGYWDAEDLIFLLKSFGEKVDVREVSQAEVEYLIENFDWKGRGKEGEEELEMVKKALLLESEEVEA